MVTEQELRDKVSELRTLGLNINASFIDLETGNIYRFTIPASPTNPITINTFMSTDEAMDYLNIFTQGL